MERIWAPWRHEYILRAKTAGCFLCDAIHGDADECSLVLKRGEHCVVVLNRYPYNNGHLMVAPYRHISDIELMSPEERTDMMDLTVDMLALLRKALRPEGFNLGYNLGKVAGAGLEEHVHQHIVPRWNGDTNFMPVLGETRVIPQSLDDLLSQLRKAMEP